MRCGDDFFGEGEGVEGGYGGGVDEEFGGGGVGEGEEACFGVFKDLGDVV